ncbi:MAG: threonine-phosphate decarboxylase [Halobacteriota archaeon]
MDYRAIDDLSTVPHGGDPDRDCLDFSANTNPVSPPGTTQAYDAALSIARRYPDPDYPQYRTAAAEYLNDTAAGDGAMIDPNHVVPTAGGLIGIRLVAECTLEPGTTALIPTPSFGEYAREVGLQGATPTFVDRAQILDADPEGHALAIVCNPNNPTGESYDRDRLSRFADRCREASTTLLVDEAFLDFTDERSMAGVPGVVVARSLTKVFGLPGLRAGFLVATGDFRDRLATARPTWGLSTPASVVGAHCLRQRAFVDRTVARVRRERERMADRLSDRYEVYESNAPFLLVDVGAEPVDRVVDRARERGVAIRDATTFRGLESHVRVAVKRPAENDELLEALGV